MKGDALASGKARTASFNVSDGAADALTTDLKILSSVQFIARYDIDNEEYEELVNKLRAGEPLPHYKWRDSVRLPLEPAVPEAPQPGTGSVEPGKPKAGYRARPVGDNVLVMRVEKGHTSTLILPDQSIAKSDVGFVTAVGEEVKYFKAGDMVLFDKFAAHGAEIELVDEEGIERAYLMLKSYDLMLVLSKIPL